jgi:hypothetical protein
MQVNDTLELFIDYIHQVIFLTTEQMHSLYDINIPPFS